MGDKRDELVLHRVELAQTLVRGALLLQEGLRLFAREFQLRHISEIALGVHRLPVLVRDDDRVIVHPHHGPVPRDHPELEGLRAGAFTEAAALRGDPLAIVGMNEVEKQLRLELPLVRFKPEHRVRLRADELHARAVERADIRETR